MLLGWPPFTELHAPVSMAADEVKRQLDRVRVRQKDHFHFHFFSLQKNNNNKIQKKSPYNSLLNQRLFSPHLNVFSFFFFLKDMFPYGFLLFPRSVCPFLYFPFFRKYSKQQKKLFFIFFSHKFPLSLLI